MNGPGSAASRSGTQRQPCGLLDPLPTGRIAIEASAGTGKTFTLTALATRYIAEQGVDASELLIVTFTRAATAEVRNRLRDRLVEAADALRGSSGPGGVPVDPLLEHLAASDRSLRLARLERAITEFDASSITTIHGFAVQVLGLLGAAAGTDPESVLVDDTEDLLDEVCADVLAAAAVEDHPSGSLPTYDRLRRAVDVAARCPDLLIVPGPGEGVACAADLLQADLVCRALAALAERRTRSGTLGFDDLLAEVRRALRSPGGEAAIHAIRGRYRVALIDEFQDTDPAQWDILSAIFAAPGAPKGPQAPDGGTLVLVGDPKQAIYSFRGADIHTYLRAVDEVDRQSSLVTNWRSDGAALHALDLLLDGTDFGDERITFSPARPAEGHRDRRLVDGDGRPQPALHLRLALGADLPRAKKSPHDIPTAEAERAVMSDLVAQVRAALDGVRIPDGPQPPPPEGDASRRSERAATTSSRPVRPSDLAVLVRSSKEAALVQAALLDEGVPAVQARGGSVMASPAAEQWRWLLEALLRPSDPARARLFALSWFVGRSPEWVAAADDRAVGEIQELLHSWNETLSAGGAGDLVRRIWSDSGVVARVLARPEGDRELTDLGHIGEILQADSGRQASVAGLLSRLAMEMPSNADAEVEADVAARRIESEADAVRIMTVWVSKGLEFPIVFCPTLWRRPAESPVIYHDAALDRRVFDVSAGRGGAAREAAAEGAERAAAEALGENLRILYVALTRARHQTVLWWAPTQGSRTTALARVLFAGRSGRVGDDSGASLPACPASHPDSALEALAPLLEGADGPIVACVVGRPTRRATAWKDPQAAAPPRELALARLERVPDRSAHRWSFTAITARADLDHSDPHGPDPHDDSAPDDARRSDEGEERDEPSDRPGGDSPPSIYAAPSSLSAASSLSAPATRSGSKASVPEEPPVSENPATAEPAGVAGTGLALLPSGASFGTMVHAVLEATDFGSDDLTGALHASIERVLPWHRTDLTPLLAAGGGPAAGRRLLAEGLLAALETPLGPLARGRRLRDFGRADRIDEMSFELRLGEGGTPPTDADVGRLILRHLAPDDPFRSWAESLAGGLFDTVLAGHLTGSIDTVLRIRDGGEPLPAVEHGRGERARFAVVDYKTNRLHPPGCVPTAADYHPNRMAEAMVQHSYPLQALLYLVALHRYLRWRLPAYRPSSHLGGALYLFVRGMTGAATPTTGDTVHGVYSWAVPPGLVVELSDLLAGRRESADAAEPPVTTVRNRNRVAAKTSARPPRRSGRNRVPVPGQLSMLDGGAPWSIPGPVGDMGGAREGFGCPEGEPIPATPRGAAAAEERS